MSPIQPTSDQFVELYIVIVFTVVITVLWHLPVVQRLIDPFKMLTVGYHELCHVVAAILTGGLVLSTTIDPNEGGCTRVEGGYPPVILSAGYFGSTIFGGLLIFASWDILASKIASFAIAIGLICPLVLVADKFTMALTIVYEGLLIGFWFIDHGSPLRWYCLFIGVMNIFYVVWDFTDERLYRRPNDSDASQFVHIYRGTSGHCWAILWIMFSVAVCIGFLLLGIVVFKKSQAQMVADAAIFLPT